MKQVILRVGLNRTDVTGHPSSALLTGAVGPCPSRASVLSVQGLGKLLGKPWSMPIPPFCIAWVELGREAQETYSICKVHNRKGSGQQHDR